MISLRHKKPIISRPYGPLTVYGYCFLVFAMVFGMATSLSGINLLYLLFGLVLAAVPVNGYIAWLCVWKIKLKRLFPDVVVAGRPCILKWEFDNRGYVFPGMEIELRELSDSYNVMVSVRKIGCRKKMIVSQGAMFHTRGYHRFDSAWLLSGFPFGLTQRYYKVLGESRGLLVWPVEIDVAEMALYLQNIGLEDIPLTRTRGRGTEFYGLREYQFGDSMRSIHWSSLAKTGAMVSREYESFSGNRIVFAIDHPRTKNDLELMVMIVAALGKQMKGNGWQIGLKAGKLTLPLLTESGFNRFMEVLSILRMTHYESESDSLQSVRIADDAVIVQVASGHNRTGEGGIILGLEDWLLKDGRLHERSRIAVGEEPVDGQI